MSRAFVKEDSTENAETALPERPISGHRNFVTAGGLRRIDAEVAALHRKLAKTPTKAAAASLARDLRYWNARRSSAELVEHAASEEVRFGSTVTLERGDGRAQTFRIVGEDEADPTAGSLSYVAPLARALIGKSAGDEFGFKGQTLTVLRVV